MTTIEVKDANNETFQIDIDKISKINGDMPVEVSDMAHDFSVMDATHIDHDIPFVDSNDNPIDVNATIKDLRSNKSDVTGLLLDIEATHSGKNLNYVIYYEDSMEKDAETFISPFNKPVLKNHDSYSEPMGRVVAVDFGNSEFTDERSAIKVKAKVTDQDAMIKFLDGRYQTVSIGGRMKTVTCSICGKTILKDGQFKFCGHMNGRKYNDQICYWGARDITYNEVSTVNSPADVYARVTKVTVITDNGNNEDINKTKKEETQMDGQSNANTASDKVRESIMNIVDEMLNGTANDSAPASNDPVGNASDDQSTGNAADTEQQVNDAAQSNAPSSEDLTAKVKELEDKVAELEKNAEELTAKVQTAEDALQTKQEELDAVKVQLDSYKDKCLALAESNKKMVVDAIIVKEKANGLKAEDEEAKRNELLKLSMKELDAYEVKTADATGASIEHIESPALAENDNVGDSVDAVPDTTADNKRKSLDDYTQEIISKLRK